MHIKCMHGTIFMLAVIMVILLKSKIIKIPREFFFKNDHSDENLTSFFFWWKLCYFHIIFNDDIKIFMIFIRSQGSCQLLNNTTTISRKRSFPKCIHKNKCCFILNFFNLERASFKVSILRY